MGIMPKKIGKGISPEQRIRRAALRLRNMYKIYGDPHEDSRNLATGLSSAQNLLEVRRVYAIIRSKTHTRGLTWLDHIAIQMFGKLGSVVEARQIFDRIVDPREESYRCMFDAYVHNGQLDDAKKIFFSLPSADPSWWSQMMAAFARFGHVKEAKEIYDWMPKRRRTTKTLLLIAYARNGYIEEAREILKTVRNPSTAELNAMLTAYALSGLLDKAKKLFDSMRNRTAGSWNCLSQAYAQKGDLRECVRVFKLMPMASLASWTAMIVGYGKNGNVGESRRIFENMPGRTVSTYNALLAAYAQNGHLQEASRVFNAMMHLRDKVSWMTMMEACTCNGRGKDALWIFHNMNLYGLEPNQAIVLGVLSAFRQLNKMEDARVFLCRMEGDYGIPPGIEHYTCIIEIMSKCSDKLQDAVELMRSMPFVPSVSLCRCLLDACKAHGDVKRAKRVVVEMVKLDSKDNSPFLSLASIYFGAGKVEELVNMMIEKGLYKGKDSLEMIIGNV